VKNTVVARNYAEALLAVAVKANGVERYGELLDAVAGAIGSDATLKAVMMSPRVRKNVKQDLLARGLKGVAPEGFVPFLAAVIQRGRQGSLPSISEAYQQLADRHFNRVHASVTMAREADAALQKVVAERLGKAIGKTVLAHFRTDPSIVGGLVVRMGDRVLDGSIKRRIQSLRTAMLKGN
jgi:F-type H+-transporting ATPase subunit delta